MKRQIALILAGLLAGVVGCRKASDDLDVNAKLDKIASRLDAIDHKLDQLGQARPMPQRPHEPDPRLTYSVPLGADDHPSGPASAKVTIVEAADFA